MKREEGDASTGCSSKDIRKVERERVGTNGSSRRSRHGRRQSDRSRIELFLILVLLLLARLVDVLVLSGEKFLFVLILLVVLDLGVLGVGEVESSRRGGNRRRRDEVLNGSGSFRSVLWTTIKG